MRKRLAPSSNPLPLCLVAVLLAGSAWAADEMISIAGTTATMGQTFWDRAACWTNETLNISVAPSDSAASSYDYRMNTSLRSPASQGLHVFHCRKFTISNPGGAKQSARIQESLTSGVGTNRFENIGIVLGECATISALDNRFADVTYEGNIADNFPISRASDYAPAIGAGTINGNATAANVIRLSGTFEGSGRLKTSSGIGGRVVIEADATSFTGMLNPNGANGWTTFGCAVFNGSVIPWNGTAIGAERATTSAQIKSLEVGSTGISLIVPISANGDSAGLLTFADGFKQTGAITVQLRGRLPEFGRYPVLRLGPQCKSLDDASALASFDQSKISFALDILVNDLRLPIAVTASQAATVSLAFKTEGDGARTLYIERFPPATVLYMR